MCLLASTPKLTEPGEDLEGEPPCYYLVLLWRSLVGLLRHSCAGRRVALKYFLGLESLLQASDSCRCTRTGACDAKDSLLGLFVEPCARKMLL